MVVRGRPVMRVGPSPLCSAARGARAARKALHASRRPRPRRERRLWTLLRCARGGWGWVGEPRAGSAPGLAGDARYRECWAGVVGLRCLPILGSPTVKFGFSAELGDQGDPHWLLGPRGPPRCLG